MAAVVVPATAAAASAFVERASSRCDRQLRAHDGTEVFALTPTQVLRLARDLRRTEPMLRRGLSRRAIRATRPLRRQLVRAARLGRVYSRAYRRDPGDESLVQEAALENALLRLERVARRSGLPACSVKLAEQ